MVIEGGVNDDSSRSQWWRWMKMLEIRKSKAGKRRGERRRGKGGEDEMRKRKEVKRSGDKNSGLKGKTGERESLEING